MDDLLDFTSSADQLGRKFALDKSGTQKDPLHVGGMEQLLMRSCPNQKKDFV